MQCRALFVDDEPSIREIYGLLGQVLGDRYIISTASGPREAKEYLGKGPVDIIISDLVMPDGCGAEFLLDVSKTHPACGRIAVSGYADQVTMAKCLTAAHRYFTKPFNPLALTGAIEQLHAIRATTDERLAKIVGSIQSLPVPSDTYLELTKALNSQSASLEWIASIVEKDPSLCSKLLQAANSAMFGGRERCYRMIDVVQLLGLELIRTLMLWIQVLELGAGKEFKPFFEKLWRHSLQVGQTAKHLRKISHAPRQEAEDAFLAGLLHDLGAVVLGASAPELYGAIIRRLDLESPELRQAELDAFGATHAETGAYLLNLWGLPAPIIQATAEHHQPLAKTANCPLVLAVQAAHELTCTATLDDLNKWHAKGMAAERETQELLSRLAHEALKPGPERNAESVQFA